jgi:hypothetical protein
MEEYSFFERAGYTKEQAKIFEEHCNMFDIPYDSLLSVLNYYREPIDNLIDSDFISQK